jgi:hypothetical protein
MLSQLREKLPNQLPQDFEPTDRYFTSLNNYFIIGKYVNDKYVVNGDEELKQAVLVFGVVQVAAVVASIALVVFSSFYIAAVGVPILCALSYAAGHFTQSKAEEVFREDHRYSLKSRITLLSPFYGSLIAYAYVGSRNEIIHQRIEWCKKEAKKSYKVLNELFRKNRGTMETIFGEMSPVLKLYCLEGPKSR